MSIGTQLSLFIEPVTEGSPDTAPSVPYRAKRKYAKPKPPTPKHQKPQWVQLSPRNAYLVVGLHKVLCGGGCGNFVAERDLVPYRAARLCPRCFAAESAIEKALGDRRAAAPAKLPLHLRAIRMAEAQRLKDGVRARAAACGCGEESEVNGPVPEGRGL